MIERSSKPAKSRNFSLAFEKMCNFVAIADTRNPDETLKQLILQCFVVLPDERFKNARQLTETLDILFGLQITENQIQGSLDLLIEEGFITGSTSTNLMLSPEVHRQIQKRVGDAIALEDKVKQVWLEEIFKRFPTLPSDQAWVALKGYLARAFRRHGIQTAALLDPSIDIAPEYSESLSFLLDDVLNDIFPIEHRAVAKAAIYNFFADVGKYIDRSTYIAQLADGAFNYFSLTVAPEVAEQFRQKLNSLTLFLDTNFLFGILNLHVHPHIEVSNELLQAIEKYRFPFDLRYHQVTEKEMISTITYFGDILRSRKWSQSLSRAAVTSRYLSGIELKYHKLNAETGIDVDSFLMPYEYVDILLKEKNILKYIPQEERVRERSDLFTEYKKYLVGKGYNKPDGAIDHDTTVLDTVRQLRSTTLTSLEAGALLVTCDYRLYRFDWENSRLQNRMACTVLPNLLWQVLRPFVPSDSDFDRSFAETFAIPEFRTIGSGASKACSKMLSLLAAYKDISEETAAKLLSNDLLINRLRKAENDEQFREYVESAIVEENSLLLEERAALSKQLAWERAEKEDKEKKLEKERRLLEQEKAEVEQALKRKGTELKSEEKLKNEERERAEYLAVKFEEEKKAREDTEQREKIEISNRKWAEKTISIYAIITASTASLILIGIFEFLVYKLPWEWLIKHSNAYGLQLAIDLLLVLLTFGFFYPKYRKWCWGAGLFPLLLIIIQLLGGPNNR